MLKGVDAGGILLRVEQGDAVVVPAHPLGVLVGQRLGGVVLADVESARGADHVDDGLLIVLTLGHAHAEVDEVWSKRRYLTVAVTVTGASLRGMVKA